MSTEDCLARLAETFAQAHPVEAARDLESLPGPQVVEFLAASSDLAAMLLGNMPAPAAIHYLGSLTATTAADVLQQYDPDQAAFLLHQLDESGRVAMLAELPDPFAEEVRDRLSYPPRSVGGIMRIRPPSIPADATVARAIEHLRRQRSGGIPYAYVVGPNQRLIGVLSVMALMHAESADAIADHMVPAQVRLTASLSLSAVIDHSGWRRFSVLPVVDEEERLVGGLEYRTLLHRWRPEDVPATDSVAAALGELYQLGISGLVQIAAGGTSHGERVVPVAEEVR